MDELEAELLSRLGRQDGANRSYQHHQSAGRADAAARMREPARRPDIENRARFRGRETLAGAVGQA